MEQTKKPEEANSISEVVMYDGFEIQKIIRESLQDFENQNTTCDFDKSIYMYL